MWVVSTLRTQCASVKTARRAIYSIKDACKWCVSFSLRLRTTQCYSNIRAKLLHLLYCDLGEKSVTWWGRRRSKILLSPSCLLPLFPFQPSVACIKPERRACCSRSLSRGYRYRHSREKNGWTIGGEHTEVHWRGKNNTFTRKMMWRELIHGFSFGGLSIAPDITHYHVNREQILQSWVHAKVKIKLSLCLIN
jgi:hypothetical protein